MEVRKRISVDFNRPDSFLQVRAMQGDGFSRQVEMILLNDGAAWLPPKGADPSIIFHHKKTGVKGFYDKLPDDSPAIVITGNIAIVTLVSAMLAEPGDVWVALSFNDEELNRLTTFPFTLSVSKNPAIGSTEVEDYIRLQWLEDKVQELKDSGAFTGPQGEVGPQGPQGEVGPRGPAGDNTAALEAAQAANTAATNANSVANSMRAEIASLSARMDTFASLPEGSTTGDAELMDIRIKADGSTAPSAGAAVRDQVNQLKQDIAAVSAVCGTLENTEGGTVIQLTDCAERPLKGLRVFGRTVQDGTPTPDAPVELESVGDGGSVSVTVSDGTSEQRLTVSTPNGLPGIPVTSGGNYTDASGQQWICDEVDFARGVYVHRVNKLRVTEASGVRSISETYVRCQTTVPRGNNYHSSKAMNTLFPYNDDYTGEFAHAYVWSNLIYWFLPKETVQNYVEANAWLSDNDFRFAYVLETPIETQIPEDELAAYAALHTYKPNTTIYNDADAQMEVNYQADTKLYIDKQFAELRNAIVSLGGNI